MVATVCAEGRPPSASGPRAQGRAYRIRKRTNHITVIVESRRARRTKASASASTRSRRAQGSKRPPIRRGSRSGPEDQPHGFRLGITTDWKTRWYADKQYADYVREDVAILKLLATGLGGPVSPTSRSSRTVTASAWTSHRASGIVIGRRGTEADRIRRRPGEADPSRSS